MAVVIALQTIFVARGGGAGLVGSVVGFGVVAGFMILFYVIPAMLLWKAAAAARTVAQGQASSLDEMLSRQRSFWRYAGIATIVVVGFYVFVLVLVVGVGALSVR